MTTQELQAQHDNALSNADNIVSAAERQHRSLTSYEKRAVDASMSEVAALKPRIAASKSSASKSIAELRAELNKTPRQRHLAAPIYGGNGEEPLLPTTLSPEYFDAFLPKLRGQGPVSAALYEAVSTSGGNVVPIIVNGRAVPLSPQDSTIRKLTTAVSTKSDINNPTVLTRAVAAIKAETSAFSVAQQTLGTFKLSAFLIGLQVSASLELFEDVNLFNSFLLNDAVSAFLELEESYFILGSGSGQPQGIVGNCTVGAVTEPDTAGNLVSVDAIWQLAAALKESFYSTASFVMSRTTALGIRRAQVGSGAYYEPTIRRENGAFTCAGFPLAFSSQMPAAARGATPVIFGAIDRGYIVGDRQGPALLCKVLDQAVSAQSGLRDILFYRRSDGRVKDPQAVVQLNIAAS
jgi:HK97 family phage major capsid protein